VNNAFAKFLSLFLHPAIFPLLGVFLLLKLPVYHFPSKVILYTLALVFCGTYVIPVAISLLLFKFKLVGSLLMQKAKDRRLPYTFGAVSFYFTAVLLQKIETLHEAYLFLLASAAVVVVHLVLLRFLKPSAHLAGIAGFLGLLMAISLKYGLNYLPLILVTIFACGLLASARYQLKAHTLNELGVGFVTGAGIVFGIMYYL
jgi:hypothetical protein